MRFESLRDRVRLEPPAVAAIAVVAAVALLFTCIAVIHGRPHVTPIPVVATGAMASAASASAAVVTSPVTKATPQASCAVSDGKVNLNTANATQLDTIPGVGPATAQSIIDWRKKNGRFSSVSELLEIDGIGDAKLAKISPHVTV